MNVELTVCVIEAVIEGVMVSKDVEAALLVTDGVDDGAWLKDRVAVRD